MGLFAENGIEFCEACMNRMCSIFQRKYEFNIPKVLTVEKHKKLLESEEKVLNTLIKEDNLDFCGECLGRLFPPERGAAKNRKKK